MPSGGLVALDAYCSWRGTEFCSQNTRDTHLPVTSALEDWRVSAGLHRQPHTYMHTPTTHTHTHTPLPTHRYSHRFKKIKDRRCYSHHCIVSLLICKKSHLYWFFHTGINATLVALSHCGSHIVTMFLKLTTMTRNHCHSSFPEEEQGHRPAAGGSGTNRGLSPWDDLQKVPWQGSGSWADPAGPLV